MGKELWVVTAYPIEPVPCAFGLAPQVLELTARPANDIEINPPKRRTQLSSVEAAIVCNPATDARIVHLNKISQGSVTAMVKRPGPNGSAETLQRFRTGSR